MKGRWIAQAAAAAAVFSLLPGEARADFVIMPLPQVFILPVMVMFSVMLVAVVARLLLLLLKIAARGGKTQRESDGSGFERTAKVAMVLGLLTFAFCLFVHICEEKSRRERRRFYEPKSNLGAIRSTEVAFFAEWGYWIGNQPMTPAADRRGMNTRVEWPSNTRFSILGFAPEGKVYCSYSLEGPDWPTAAQGFTAKAHCDFDGDGSVSVFTITNTSTDITHSGGTY